MKAASWMLLAAFGSPLQAAPRNPFLLPPSTCETLLKRLDGWQLRGVFYRPGPESSFALMKLSRQQWQRVKEGQFIELNVQVTTLLVGQMKVSLGGDCEGSNYYWKIRGGADDKSNRGSRTDVAAADDPGEKEYHPDAG